jgi:hypothetical protein
MKFTIVVLFGLLTVSSYAQDVQYTEIQEECLATDTCLFDMSSSFMIKTVPIVGYDGQIDGEGLSILSNITDLLHPKAEYCFQGEAFKICDLLNLMAYDTGHVSITKFACKVVEGRVVLRYTAESDWGRMVEKNSFLITKCADTI